MGILKDQERRQKEYAKVRGQKGHPGHRQQLLQPKEVVDLIPERFTCECRRFKQVEEFYVHLQIEFPKH